MRDIVADAKEIRRLQGCGMSLWQLLLLAWKYEIDTSTAARILADNEEIDNLAKLLALIADVERGNKAHLILHCRLSATEWQHEHKSPVLQEDGE